MGLQDKRKSKGLSQSQLAERSGVNVRLIQAYEQGQKNISKASVEKALKLADALDCGVRELIN